MNALTSTLVIGVGATLVMDLWGIARRPLLGLAPPDYGLVGRWIAHMARLRFRHDAIAAAEAIKGERLIGWIVHYLTGVAFAGVLVALWGTDWILAPTFLPAMAVGLGSVAAPFLLMQPGMGLGIAARRAPRPRAVRIQSVLTHTIFGLGLYGAGWIAHVAQRA
jgi:hypothetical protein